MTHRIRSILNITIWGPTSIDKTKRTSIKNTIGIALQEGFNKWAKAGLTAFLSYEYRNFALTDTTNIPGQRIINNYKESSLSIGGELSKNKENYYITIF